MLEIDIQKKLSQFQLEFKQILQPGVTALFGKSGVGKTTLLNIIAGLDQPDQGRILLNRQVLFDSGARVNQSPAARRIGYVFQDSRLFPHLSVKKNLVYGYREMRGIEHPLHLDKVVTLLELEDLLPRYPGRLSMGEKQRVAIGRALLRQPSLLLMDEPLASLDAPRKIQILPFLKRVCDELEIPILYVSHLLDEIMHLAHHMAFITDGHCVAHGSLVEVLSRHDVQKFYGLEEVGSILETRVSGHDPAYGLTFLSHPGGQISVARLEVPLEHQIRVRILPRDVTIAYNPPVESSVLNFLKGRVDSIVKDGSSHMDILLDVGNPLWARITRKSCDRLGLEKGKKIYALIKSAAVLR
ncbi:MAG: molybdenum ABC transporter ATP-binding protein [SAR324 cluster bacterium]|nr:molybdenum ABC transporter ATP-binding protein [SAR324 cluster bacterium]